MSKSARSQKSTTLATYPFSGMATLIHSKNIRMIDEELFPFPCLPGVTQVSGQHNSLEVVYR